MTDSQNGAMSCTVGGKEAGDDFDYVVCTLFAACTLNLIDSQKPAGDGLCTVCRKPTAMGLKCEHPAFLRHMVSAAVLDTFKKLPPSPETGGRVVRFVPQPLDVAIERNGQIEFQGPMMLAGQPQDSAGGFRIRLSLVYDEPLQGPKAAPRLAESDILTEE